jgi:hypothetical protein
MRPDLSTDALEDRWAGALLLNALGDAAGCPREAAGLRGQAGGWHPLSLPPAERFREPVPNPWNLWPPTEQTHGLCGVVSDDTATRLVLVEPWLAHDQPLTLNEDSWLHWLRHRPAESASWREAMADAQAQQWLAMYAQRDQQTPLEHPGPADFYRPGQPVMMGTFLFGSLALSAAHRSAEKVYDIFRGFCRLDQTYGSVITGLMAAALAGFCRETIEPAERAPWLARQWERLLNISSAGDATEDAVFHVRARVRWLQDELLPVLDPATPDATLQRIKTDLYDHPQRTVQGPLKPFDPLLQGSQVWLAIALGRGEPKASLQWVIAMPGDTDTLASHVGLLLGAAHGRQALHAGPVAPLLETCQQTTERLFDRTLSQRLSAYNRAAEQWR